MLIKGMILVQHEADQNRAKNPCQFTRLSVAQNVFAAKCPCPPKWVHGTAELHHNDTIQPLKKATLAERAVSYKMAT